MENNSNEKEERYEQQPSLNGQNMDNVNSQDSYIDDQIPADEQDENSVEKKAEWPFSQLHQQISDVPDGAKEDTDIKDDSEEKSKDADETSTKERITSIRPYKSDWRL